MKTEKRHGAIAIAFACVLATLPALSSADDSQALVARFEHVAEADLKSQYLSCARVSSQRMLGMDEAAVCSIVAEVLKKRSFGGDFDALLAWWRLHRDEPVAAEAGGRGL